MKSPTILVTGASGFVGRHTLQPLVAMGFKVYATARKPGPPIAGVEWAAADLLDPAARRCLIHRYRPTHLLHLAWYAEHGKFWQARENLAWLDGSLDLCTTFAEAGGRRLVGIGTCAEYDWHGAPPCPWHEDTACVPVSIYGKAKYALFRQLETLASRHGLSFAWARLFFTFGPFEPPSKLVSSVITALLDNRRIACGSGQAIRDFSDARDIGAALAALAGSDALGAINVASGRAVSVGAVAQILGERLGKPWLIELGALPDRPDEPPVIVAATARLLAATGYVFPPLEQRLVEVIDEFKKGL